MRHHLAWILLLSIAFVTPFAQAGDDSDRKQLLSDIAARLETIANKLYHVDSRSGVDEIVDAQSAMSDIERFVDKLSGSVRPCCRATRLRLPTPHEHLAGESVREGEDRV